MALPSRITLQFGETRAFDEIRTDPVAQGTYRREWRQSVVQRSFEITWPRLSPTERDSLVAEFEARKGGAGQLTLVHPTEGALNVRFEDDSLAISRRTALWYSASIRVAEDLPGTL